MTEEKQELNVQKLSHKQLAAELRRAANQTYGGKGFVLNGVDFGDQRSKNRAGVINMDAIVNLIVLENTKTAKVFEYHENGSAKRYARKDQLGLGSLSSYLR